MTQPPDKPRQQSLFEPTPVDASDASPAKPARDAKRRKGGGGVQPHETDDLVTKVAAALPPNLRLGTSSWSFPGWRGLVYSADSPATKLAKDGLAAYAKFPLFRTVGVDRTFYAPVGRSTFAEYAAAVPDDFRFLVKAWSEVTSPTRDWPEKGPSPHHLDAAVAIDRLIAPAVAGLGDKLGVLLFQLPPQGDEATKAPERFADRLHAFFAALPKDVPKAIELRDRELLCPQLFAALAATGVTYGFAVHSSLPNLQRQRELAPDDGPLVLRWMLQPGMRYGQAKADFEPFDRLAAPDTGSRAAVVDLIADAVPKGRQILVVANNKAEGSAPLTLLHLAATLTGNAIPTAVGDTEPGPLPPGWGAS
ncbi:MAG: hypothetical protein RL398_2617 [Planctomycetota bacterium]